jgi:hypothetical protein
MKWLPKVKPTPPKPVLGDRRTVKRYAWFPVKLSNGYRVWLENYSVVEEWREWEVWCGYSDFSQVNDSCMVVGWQCVEVVQ